MSFYQPWLCVAGVEVANAARTSAYLANCEVNGFTAPGSPYNDDCWCELLFEDSPFVSPEADDAPWYEAGRAESRRFYGIVLERAEPLPVIGRTVTRTRNGGSVGPLRLRPLIIAFEGIIWAGDENGMAYGQSWLQDALAGRWCKTGCSDDELRVLISCPDAELISDAEGYVDDYREIGGYEADPTFWGESRWYRDAYRIGIADGPVYQDISGIERGIGQRVSFQLVAGVPYMFNAQHFAPYNCWEIANGASVCALVSTSSWSSGPIGWTRDATTFIQLETPDANVADSQITITSTRSLDGLCPTAIVPHPELTIGVTMHPSEILRIDGIRRIVEVLNPTTRRWEPALDRLTYDPPLRFVDIDSCEQMCICVASVGGLVKASLDVVPREFG